MGRETGAALQAGGGVRARDYVNQAWTVAAEVAVGGALPHGRASGLLIGFGPLVSCGAYTPPMRTDTPIDLIRAIPISTRLRVAFGLFLLAIVVGTTGYMTIS